MHRARLTPTLRPATLKNYDAALKHLFAYMFPSPDALRAATLPFGRRVLHNALLAFRPGSYAIPSAALAGISLLHNILELPSLGKRWYTSMLRGIDFMRRQRNAVTRQAATLSASVMRSALLASWLRLCRPERDDAVYMRLMRDHVMSLVAYLAMLRRGEISNVHWVQLPRYDNAVVLFVPAPSKTRPRVVELFQHATSGACDPVRWIRYWTSSPAYRDALRPNDAMTVDGVHGSSGPGHSAPAFPLFPHPFANAHARSAVLSANRVAKLLRSWLRTYSTSRGDGLTSYSPHSWRRGGATAAKLAGVPLEQVHQMGGWKLGTTAQRDYLARSRINTAQAIWPVSLDDEDYVPLARSEHGIPTLASSLFTAHDATWRLPHRPHVRLPAPRRLPRPNAVSLDSSTSSQSEEEAWIPVIESDAD